MNAEMGLEPMDLLDIGGGYSLLKNCVENNFVTAGSIINENLDDLFPED